MKSKTVYLLLFLIFVLIIILLVRSNSQKSSQHEPTRPVEQTIPLPTSDLSGFKLVSTSLTNQTIGITEPIRLQFNQPISAENIVFTFQPEKEITSIIGINPSEIILDPVDGWGFSITYTLKILQSSKSSSNQALDRDYVYIFKTPPYSGI